MASKKLPLKGLDKAPEFFIDGIADIHFLGVNTRYVLYRNGTDAKGGAVRQVIFTVIIPTGSLASVLRQLFGFAVEHRLPVPGQDATR